MQSLNSTPEGFRIAKSAIHKLLLIEKDDKTKVIRTCTIIPSAVFAKKSGYDISKVSLENLPNDFEGYLLISGWDCKFVNLLKIKNGRPVKRINLISRYQFEHRTKATGRTEEQICPPAVWVPELAWVCAIVPTGDQIADAEHCQEIGNWAETQNGTYEVPDCYENGENGYDPFQDCLSGENPDNCYCEFFGLGCWPDETQFPEIQNQVQNPCIHNMVDEAINRGCQNQLTSFINTSFATNEHFYLYFYDSPLGTIVGEDGYTACYPLSWGDTKVQITLNNSPGTLNGASREYIAITIFHEVLHAWIDYFSPSQNTALANHELMATQQYINKMADALQELYPNIPRQDALDMAWGGLSATSAWAALSQADKDRINQTNIDYRTLMKGTPCP